ncbi:hypothetical protein SFRURICE_019766 [Spodoptera frugiperda]|nr:hypothetical protein SFRURICE_019766 [Spodoptera frugiperda]
MEHLHPDFMEMIPSPTEDCLAPVGQLLQEHVLWLWLLFLFKTNEALLCYNCSTTQREWSRCGGDFVPTNLGFNSTRIKRNVLCEVMECKGASCVDSAERMLPTDRRRYTSPIHMLKQSTRCVCVEQIGATRRPAWCLLLHNIFISR